MPGTAKEHESHNFCMTTFYISHASISCVLYYYLRWNVSEKLNLRAAGICLLVYFPLCFLGKIVAVNICMYLAVFVIFKLLVVFNTLFTICVCFSMHVLYDIRRFYFWARCPLCQFGSPSKKSNLWLWLSLHIIRGNKLYFVARTSKRSTCLLAFIVLFFLYTKLYNAMVL